MDIRQHLPVGESEHIVPEHLQLHVATPVVGELQPPPMVWPIHLDHKALDGPEKVQPVRPAEDMPFVRVVPASALRPFVRRERPLQCLLGRAVPAR